MKETEIRPQDLFDDYLKVVKQDIVSFFSEKKSFVEVPCPVCSSEDSPLAFQKEGFDYLECTKCGTLYVSPRPSKQMINEFYKKSQTSKFWAERFYKETKDARREKILRPKAVEVSNITKKYLESKKRFVDIGSGYGTFLEEIEKQQVFPEIYGIEPSSDLATVCRNKGFKIIQSPLENTKIEGFFNFGTSFELFEHLYSPVDFLLAANRILAKRGILYLTTLNCKGFDLLILRQNSKSIFPPHHINFVNPRSLEMILSRAGFEIIDISTPGKLDVDIVLNYAKHNEIDCDNFTKTLLFESHESTRGEFQLFLQGNKLSSHIRAIARKVVDKRS